MKKIKIISLVASAVIFFTLSAVSLTSWENRSHTIRSQQTFISYTVTIHIPTSSVQGPCQLIVALMNDMGQIISAQNYRPGVLVYNFTEQGPVTGVRTAILTHLIGDSNTIGVCSVTFTTDSKNGTFLNGTSYSFNLYPVSTSAKILPEPITQH
jgi:hypothetical protein